MSSPAPPTPAVLVIAGSDSSGGAGLVRDLRTLRDQAVEAVCAVTAVTAQSHSRVCDVHPVPPELIRAQILCALQSGRVKAVKIGMLGTAGAVEAVAQALAEVPDIPVVLDPVLRSSSGGELLDEAGLRAMQQKLFPLTSLLTPNLPEAAVLCGAQSQPRPDVPTRLAWAAHLLALGPKAVLVKGGHASDAEAADLLAGADGARSWLASPRLPGSVRGTGCALASGIAAGLARDEPLEEACWIARRYILDLLADTA